MDVDEVLCEIGSFGKYQKLVFFLVLVPCMMPFFSTFGQLLMISSPPLCCQPNVGQNESLSAANESTCIGGFDVPMFGTWSDDSQQEFVICESSLNVTLFQIIIGVAGMLGGIVAGFFEDRFGRKLSYFIALTVFISFGFGSSFATNYWSWLIGRFVLSITIPILLYVPYIMSVELVGPEYRARLAVYGSTATALGIVAVSYIASILRNWRLFACVTSLPFLLLFPLWRVMPESPRWYLAHEKFSHAVRVLRKLAEVNGCKKLTDEHVTELKAHFYSQKDKTEENELEYTMTDLFKHRSLRRTTICVAVSCFSSCSVNMGLYFYIYLLGGDAYMNFALSGLVQLPAYMLALPLMSRVGRRNMLCWAMIISGAACTTTRIFEDNYGAVLPLFLIGVTGSSIAILVFSLFTAELYPTAVRSSGLYFSSMMGYIGVTLIPLVNYLGFGSSLPLMVLGVISIIGGCFSFLLRETKDEHLQENFTKTIDNEI